MESNMIKTILHPIRMKIIQEIMTKKTATTKDIAKICDDIPQATLYRNINVLIKNNIIAVVSENKVRGVVEKVYKINENPYTKVDNIIKENNKEDMLNLFYNFSMESLGDFQRYVNNEKTDFSKDTIGFRNYMLYLTDEESIELMTEVRKIIEKKMNNKKTVECKLRKLSTVFIPVDNE